MIHICPSCGASWSRADSRRKSCPLCGAHSTGYFTEEGCQSPTFKRWQSLWSDGYRPIPPWDRLQRGEELPLKILKPRARWRWQYKSLSAGSPPSLRPPPR